MSILTPPSADRLNQILGLVGSTTQNLINTNAPGAQAVRGTMREIGRMPPLSLPGGGVFGSESGGVLGQSLQTEIPSATLPIYQNDPARKLALTSTEGGAAEGQATSDLLNTQYQQAIQQQLQRMLVGLGISPLRAGTFGGAYGLLSSLLGI